VSSLARDLTRAEIGADKDRIALQGIAETTSSCRLVSDMVTGHSFEMNVRPALKLTRRTVDANDGGP
jgi:hypothetical protein